MINLHPYLSFHPWTGLSVDPNHSIQCINRTKYTVGLVGISDIFALCQAKPPSAQRGIVLWWCLRSSPHLDEGSRARLLLPHRATVLCQPFPGGSWALPCDHAEILCALANGLLWKLFNGFRHTLSRDPPRLLLTLASVSWLNGPELRSFVHRCPNTPRIQ